ncbi:hypothetical protein [Streptococcus uberis]|uniref:hypothetical protein n=1 Tax=Streptococcus uberis TaxID=1349 RepID=UPI0038924CAD
MKIKEVKEAIKFLKFMKNEKHNVMAVSAFGNIHYCIVDLYKKDIFGNIDVEGTEIDLLKETL